MRAITTFQQVLSTSQTASLRTRVQKGVTLVETSMVMGIVGILSAVGISMTQPPQMELTCVQQEIPAAVMQAMHLARAKGTNVIVALGQPELGPDVLPVKLPSHVKWGKPAQIPLPPGMDAPVVAGTTGEAHAKVTITPRHTATATTWFLNDGTDALCMRLSGHGHLQLLRWRAARKSWTRV
jgi:prepilin-type N-terminal cleavage/methylation domain-containing protein